MKYIINKMKKNNFLFLYRQITIDPKTKNLIYKTIE